MLKQSGRPELPRPAVSVCSQDYFKGTLDALASATRLWESCESVKDSEQIES